MAVALGVLILIVLTCSFSSATTDDEILQQTLTAIIRQLMLQQQFVEERIRSDGGSGIKQVRHTKLGTATYFSETHGGKTLCAMHEHANNMRTVGLGEFTAVLNGIEFRTRHNDYRLKMPSRSDKGYHLTEDIPFPDVPEAVLNKTDINDQIIEMREWFKAWKEQNYTVRDYRKHFKPILCYLEGAWHANSGDIEESFFSDRHFLDATTWFDLMDKIAFTSYTGRKSQLENYAYLPTRIFGVSNGTIPFPILAQWNYRILCHPLKNDLPFNRLRVRDDINIRMGNKQTYDTYVNARAGRFYLDPYDIGDPNLEGIVKDGNGLLDQLMYEIPGKDNYPGKITDDALDATAYELFEGSNKKLNAARYNRFYKVEKEGAMGLQVRARGYSDDNLFVALNTQEKITGMTLELCNRKEGCRSWNQKVSYAIPIEIMYMTPLSKWNPYEIEHKGLEKSPEGKTVNADNRNGGLTLEKAYNGTNEKYYYRIPAEFYTGGEVEVDPADTAQGGDVGMLDSNGTLRKVRAAGHRIIMPEIPGCGKIRQRYPIMPIHAEGGAIYKALDALKDIVLEAVRYTHMLKEGKGGNASEPAGYNRGNFKTSPATDSHQHLISITLSQFYSMVNGQSVTITTEQANGHSHELIVKYYSNTQRLAWTRCDGRRRCKDRHGKEIFPATD